jgi:hypothetical protein
MEESYIASIYVWVDDSLKLFSLMNPKKKKRNLKEGAFMRRFDQFAM